MVERRASEPLVAGPLVQPRERIEFAPVLTGSGDPGIEAPLGGRRDNREVDDGWTWKSPTGSGSDPVLERVRHGRRIRPPRGLPLGDEGSAPISSVERATRSDSWIPTLLVENTSGDPIAVRLNGFRLGTATSGRNCIRLPRTVGEIVLEFVPLGRHQQLAFPIHLGESLHWRVRVGPGGWLKYDLTSMTPAESSCRR